MYIQTSLLSSEKDRQIHQFLFRLDICSPAFQASVNYISISLLHIEGGFIGLESTKRRQTKLMDSYNVDAILLVLTDPCLIDDEELVREKVSILASDADTKSHNLQMKFNPSSVELLTSRHRLIEESSYFRSLLDGNFCESNLKHVPVRWSLEPFIYVLQFIHGYPLNITFNNFIPLLEAQASLSCSFSEIPYDLLYSCIDHPELTVDSEKQLCEALVIWILNDAQSSHCSSGNYKFDLLKKVRVNLLPLEFVTGLTRYFPQFAFEVINKIFNLLEDNSSIILQQIAEEKCDDFRIRLTKFSEKVVLSSCIQVTVALLFLAIIPSDWNVVSKRRTIRDFLELDRHKGNRVQVPDIVAKTLSFESVHEIDISQCLKLHFGGFIKWFTLAFTSVKVLKASHCMQIKMEDIYSLLLNCSTLTEVDLTVDISQIVSNKVSVVSETTEQCRISYGHGYDILKELSSNPTFSNISKLTLEGRIEIRDVDLMRISSFSSALSYLNIKGCAHVSDMGISGLLSKSPKIHSLILSYTSFGPISVSTLCSVHACPDIFHEDANKKYSKTMAYRLQELQIDGCKGLDQVMISQLLGQAYMLKILFLRQTPLTDSALGCFRGSTLESLDISETMVSMEALICLIKKNSRIRILGATGCKHFDPLNSDNLVPTGSANFENQFFELSSSCILEEISFGWGFSFISVERLGYLTKLRRISFGLGASPGHHILFALPQICPLLESVVLTFQAISDDLIRNFMELENLRILELSCCHGDLSVISFQKTMLTLRRLKLQWVAQWMTNDDLSILTENCPNIKELSLSGCKLLNSASQEIIARKCPGLILLHIEECGKVTSDGICSLFNCKAIEDLLLRHNGKGIGRKVLLDAALKLPMLRHLAVDLCDACDGGFDSPSHYDRCFLTTLRISRCKSQQCGFDLKRMEAFRPVHQETIVLEWNNKELRTTVVEERI